MTSVPVFLQSNGERIFYESEEETTVISLTVVCIVDLPGSLYATIFSHSHKGFDG